jgi:hypothetical protein
MKITLTPEESEEFFHNALCNALGTGYIYGYGIDIAINESEYQEAKAKLNNPCYEDILMQVLRDGNTLTMADMEGGMGEVSITLADIHERVQQTPLVHLVAMINETDDAETADAIIQTVFYQDIIFG